MSKGIHAALIEDSERLQIIERLLMNADWPLSAQEIAMGAYPHANPPKVMLNVSTYIGEMRGEQNREKGHVVSFATTWKVTGPGGFVGRRINKDNTVTFFIQHGKLPFHDGRPRYYLIAAPGWRPRWRIDERGALVKCGVRSAECGIDPKPASCILHPASVLCAHCGTPLPPEHDGPPFCPGPQDACRKAWHEKLQGNLF